MAPTPMKKNAPPLPPPEEDDQMVPPDVPAEAPPAQNADAPPVEGSPAEEEAEEKAMMKSLLETTKKVLKQNEVLKAQVAELQKGRKAAKAAPPEEVDEHIPVESLPVHNDDERVRGKPHKDQAVGAVLDTRAGTKENPKVFGKAFDNAVSKAVDERIAGIEEKFQSIVKAHTPVPMGYANTPEGREWSSLPIEQQVRKAIELDRKMAGGDYWAPNQFGWYKGTRATRIAVVKELRKALA